MKSDKTSMGLAFILVLLFFSIVTLAFWDFVREAIIVPVYYVLWLANLMLKSIAQEVYLVLFVLVCIIIGINTLVNARWRQLSRRVAVEKFTSTSRYTHWRRLSNNLYTSSITKAGFIRETRQFILTILAFQHSIEIEEVEAQIENQDLPVPDVILTLIQERKIKNLKPVIRRHASFFVRLRRRFFEEEMPESPYTDTPILEIVAYIEHLLEIENAAN